MWWTLLGKVRAHHWGGAGEGEQLEARVGGEEVGAPAAAGQHAEGALGQVGGLGQDLRNDQRPDRRLGRRLHHEGAPAGAPLHDPKMMPAWSG